VKALDQHKRNIKGLGPKDKLANIFYRTLKLFGEKDLTIAIYWKEIMKDELIRE
jgi:hypothetical protein